MEALHQQATELLLMEQDRIPEGPLVILGDQNADDAENLSISLPSNALRFYVRYARDAEDYTARGLTTHAAWQPDADAYVRCAIIFLSREKEVTELRVAAAVSALPNLEEIFLLGHNRLGAKSIHKRFRKRFDEVDRVASARHSGLIRLAKPKPEATEALDALWQEWSLDVDGTQQTIFDLPGVFSRGSLDRGSEMLLQSLGAFRQKEVLELGCGSGVLSIAYATRVPEAQITLVDHDTMAVASARKNIEHAEINDRVNVIFGDVESVRGRRFDLVFTNPPFHAGSEMTTATAERWFEAVKALLNPGGTFLLVANQHLPYRRTLQEAFYDVELVEEDSRYRVWRARKPK